MPSFEEGFSKEGDAINAEAANVNKLFEQGKIQEAVAAQDALNAKVTAPVKATDGAKDAIMAGAKVGGVVVAVGALFLIVKKIFGRK